MPPRSMTLTMSYYEFEIKKVYHEGMGMTQAEASILNSTRREEIRLAASKELHRMRPMGEGGLLAQGQIEALSLLVKDLDENFQFRIKPSGKARSGSLNQEIQLVAMERVEQEARKHGIQLSSEKFDQAVQEWAQDKAIIGEARRRFEERLKLNALPLAEIFGT